MWTIRDRLYMETRTGTPPTAAYHQNISRSSAGLSTRGLFFSQDDVDRAADVCVLGRTGRDQLFGVEDPIGKVIRVKNLPCKVVATLIPKGQSLSVQHQDD